LGDKTSENRELTICQYSYEILDIIMKVLPIITPIITLMFHDMLSREHINMQIRYSV